MNLIAVHQPRVVVERLHVDWNFQPRNAAKRHHFAALGLTGLLRRGLSALAYSFGNFIQISIIIVISKTIAISNPTGIKAITPISISGACKVLSKFRTIIIDGLNLFQQVIRTVRDLVRGARIPGSYDVNVRLVADDLHKRPALGLVDVQRESEACGTSSALPARSPALHPCKLEVRPVSVEDVPPVKPAISRPFYFLDASEQIGSLNLSAEVFPLALILLGDVLHLVPVVLGWRILGKSLSSGHAVRKAFE